MVYNISTKGFVLSEKNLDEIEKQTQKLNKFLPSLDSDLPFLEIIIRKHKKRRRNELQEGFDMGHEGKPIIKINPKNKMPFYYDGTIMLRLPKKPLVVKISGNNIDEAIKTSFNLMLQELKKYKGRHYKSNSEYPDHSTIRKS